jgi:hypothetical protein
MIRLTVVLKDQEDAFESDALGWDLKDNGDLYIVHSEGLHRAIAAGAWVEVVSERVEEEA